MIKKLRFKFVMINMSIVTVLLCVILGLVFYFTSANLEAESINMMQNIAGQPCDWELQTQLMKMCTYHISRFSSGFAASW